MNHEFVHIEVKPPLHSPMAYCGRGSDRRRLVNSGHKVYISTSEHVHIMICMSDVVKHSLVLVVVNSYWSEACVIMCTYVHVMFSIGFVPIFVHCPVS